MSARSHKLRLSGSECLKEISYQLPVAGTHESSETAGRPKRSAAPVGTARLNVLGVSPAVDEVT